MNEIYEATYPEVIGKDQFSVELLDIDKFIKRNNVKEITNPTFFGYNGLPTPDGLLSNEIFGITQADRAGIFGYIDLVEYFIDPSCYKALLRLDRKFNEIVHGTNFFTINDNGELVEDYENGKTGIKWLKQNFGKIKLKRTDSRKRDMKIKYIQHNFESGKMFINKYLVIPPYYRDVNTGSRHEGVGQINTLYVHLITAATSLRENNNYGLSMADNTCGRIQDTLKAIYDYFCGNKNDIISDPGTGMSGKFGILKRANLSKTTDYSCRLVISAPELKVETIDDLMVDLDHSGVPLAAVATDFYPFVLYHMRRFFEREYLGVYEDDCYDSNGELIHVYLKNAMYVYNDDELNKQLNRYLYSPNDRFRPVEAPIDYEKSGIPDDDEHRIYMAFKGTPTTKPEDYGDYPEAVIHRPLTWTDIIYMASVEASQDKCVSITRYPYDSYTNTIYTKVTVLSTQETEPLYINEKFYKFYPKIRLKDINTPTETLFRDTLTMSNLYLKGMGGDYDGDTVNCKGSYFKETNEEQLEYLNSKANYINIGCENVRVSSNEAVQSIYNLTKVLYGDDKKLTSPQF